MRFGIVSPPVPGHLHPMGALGRELAARGHHVTVFHMPDLARQVGKEDLEFWPVGQSDHPAGSLPESLEQLARLTGNAALRFTIAAVARTSVMFCRDLPGAAKAAGIDALIVDQMEPAGGAVAEYLGMPFVTVCNALALNRDPIVPPAFTPWRYRRHTVAQNSQRRRVCGVRLGDPANHPCRRGLSHAVGTAPAGGVQTTRISQRAQICQMPREFDFPRTGLPPLLPLSRAPAASKAAVRCRFPGTGSTADRLIYASLGTLQNRHLPVFRLFAEACAGPGRPTGAHPRRRLVRRAGGGPSGPAVGRGLRTPAGRSRTSQPDADSCRPQHGPRLAERWRADGRRAADLRAACHRPPCRARRHRQNRPRGRPDCGNAQGRHRRSPRPSGVSDGGRTPADAVPTSGGDCFGRNGGGAGRPGLIGLRKR